ncbi:MAG TPA: tRNA lysidine(34) synthetase TilS, partial [Pseudoxanthomonas sp.]|nr:tRNA lysidine(34) synthetase TilS [Pseudoxanthomonas sp.]
DLLHVQCRREPLPETWHVQWQGHEPLALPGGDLLRLEGAASLPVPLRVFARQGGERMTLPGRTQSRTLKNLLQQLGVPPWEREVLPLLSDVGGELVAVADLAYSSGFDAWLRGAGARLRWLRQE